MPFKPINDRLIAEIIKLSNLSQDNVESIASSELKEMIDLIVVYVHSRRDQEGILEQLIQITKQIRLKIRSSLDAQKQVEQLVSRGIDVDLALQHGELLKMLPDKEFQRLVQIITDENRRRWEEKKNAEITG